MHPLVGGVLPPVEGLRRMVFRSVVLLGSLWAVKAVPVVIAPETVPGAARMGRPHVPGRRARRLSGSPSGNSPLAC